MEGFRGNESWTSSEASSSESLSRARFRFAQQQQVPNLDSTSTEWTDEKHNLYLKSMEASFVDQLYDSMDFLPWKSQKEKFTGSKSSRQTHRTSSGQFKVLRGGCWKKIDFETPGFRRAVSWQVLGSSTLDRDPSLVCLPRVVIFKIMLHRKVSDQNFVDEEQGEDTSNERSSKKQKTLAYYASYDQAIL